MTNTDSNPLAGRRLGALASAAAVALLIGTSIAGAQSASTIVPPRADSTQSRAPLLKPPQPPPPPRAVSLSAGAAARRTPTAPLNVLRAPAAAARPDSIAQRAVVVPTVPPPDAVAHCADGTYVTAPADPATCSQHGGLKAAFLRASTPPRPGAASAANAPVSAQISRSVVRTPDAAPAGATMRCKDGTWLTGARSADRCANNGGVATIVTAQQAPPPQPQKRP
jgi:hypothetical protein